MCSPIWEGDVRNDIDKNITVYRVECVEVVDLDQLLGEHHPPGGVADGVQGRGPGGEPDHVGNHNQHDARYSGLCGQTNLVRLGFRNKLFVGTILIKNGTISMKVGTIAVR